MVKRFALLDSQTILREIEKPRRVFDSSVYLDFCHVMRNSLESSRKWHMIFGILYCEQFLTLKIKLYRMRKKTLQKYSGATHKKANNQYQYIGQKYSDIMVSQIQSDDESSKIMSAIQNSSFYNNKDRHIKIKLQKWKQLLVSEEGDNALWKQNKLNYLKLLKLMCECELIVDPFTKFPSKDQLAILQKHQIQRIIDQVQNKVKFPQKLIKQSKENRSMISTNKAQRQTQFDKHQHKFTELADKEPTNNEEIILKKITLKDLPIKSSKSYERTYILQTEEANQYKFKQMKDSIINQSSIKKTVENKTKNWKNQLKQEQFSQKQHINYKFQMIDDQNLSLNNTQKLWYRNTLSDSINLEIYPHSISQQIRKYSKKISYLIKRSDNDHESRRYDSIKARQGLDLINNLNNYQCNNEGNDNKNKSIIANRQYFGIRKPLSIICRQENRLSKKQFESLDIRSFQTRLHQQKTCCQCLYSEAR